MKLTIDKLSFSYGRREVLHNISFTLASGEFMSVLGQNGAGKSTLFKCILGSLLPYSGRILIDGKDRKNMSRRECAQAISYIPQMHYTAFGYTVLDTVLMGVGRQIGMLSQPKKEHVDIAMDAICRVGIEQLRDRNFAGISGGEQQLVLIARAIAQQSEFLIMDEPASTLDYGNQFRILKLVRALADSGYGVLMSTHNPQHALGYSDTVLALHGKEAIAYGKTSDKLNEELIHNLYDVDAEFVSSASGVIIVPKGVD